MIFIDEAIAGAAITWVLLSWIKIWIKPNAKIQKYLCLKCITFWGTLIITLNPITAAIAALIAMLVDTYQNNTNITL